MTLDPVEHGGHVWHDTRGPESACERCHLMYALWTGARCYVAPDCDAVYAPSVECERELGHPGEHRSQVVWGQPEIDNEELSTR